MKWLAALLLACGDLGKHTLGGGARAGEGRRGVTKPVELTQIWIDLVELVIKKGRTTP